MYRPILPHYRRPILLQTESGRRKLSQIAVDRVQAQDGHYHVLYIGTGTHNVKNEENACCFVCLCTHAVDNHIYPHEDGYYKYTNTHYIHTQTIYHSSTLKLSINVLLSDDSVVLKVITIYNKDTDTMEEVLLEELQVFKVLYF